MRLCFWCKGGLQVLATIIGTSAVCAFIVLFQMGGSALRDLLLITLPLYLIGCGAISLLAMSIGLYNGMLPLALSFGSTRREALVGLHLYRLLPAAGAAALTGLLALFSGGEDTFHAPDILLLSLGIFLLGGALGSVLGMLCYRFGTAAAVITGVLLLVVGIGAGGLFIFSLLTDRSVLPPLAGRMHLAPVSLLFGAGVYLLTMIPEGRIIRSYQVKQ